MTKSRTQVGYIADESIASSNATTKQNSNDGDMSKGHRSRLKELPMAKAGNILSNKIMCYRIIT